MSTDLLPFDLDAEQAVLSTVLVAPETLDDLRPLLQPSDFHDARHQVIYSAMLRLDRGREPDWVNTVSFLREEGKTEAAGGEPYLTYLVGMDVTYTRGLQYAVTVRTCAQQRRALGVVGELGRLAYHGDLDALAGKAEELRAMIAQGKAGEDASAGVWTADALLAAQLPEPVWLVPSMLPIGLTILGGKPKVGKSWLALQVAQAVASGGVALGQRVGRARVLYVALEDNAHSLKGRMTKQGWSIGLSADFMLAPEFRQMIGDLSRGGAGKLARRIEAGAYRLAVIDTLSRAASGDQNDVAQMTAALAPVQEAAGKLEAGILLIDHHNKLATGTDLLGDLLGSTAKGAVADTGWGLYRERGKAGAKLALEGRAVQYQALALRWDGLTCCWQVEGNVDELDVTENRQAILDALEGLGRSKVGDVAQAVCRNRGNVYKDLQDLAAAGRVVRLGDTYGLPYLGVVER